MTSDGARDATALIGLTAVLEGHLLAGDLDPHLVGHLVRWLRSAGVLDATAGTPELRVLLANLNQRLRFALGEYGDPPPSG